MPLQSDEFLPEPLSDERLQQLAPVRSLIPHEDLATPPLPPPPEPSPFGPLSGFAQSDLGGFRDRQADLASNYQEFITERDQASITRGLLSVQEDRGFDGVFMDKWLRMDREQHMKAMGDLLVSDVRKEGFGEWWIRNKGDRGTIQTLTRDIVPYSKQVIQKLKMEKVTLAFERMAFEKDDALDRTIALSYMMDAKTQPAGIGAKAGQIAYNSLPFMAEMILTRKVYTGAKAGTQLAMGRMLQAMAKQSGRVGQITRGGIASASFGVGAAAQSAAGNPFGVRANMLERMLPGYSIDEAGLLELDMDARDDTFEALWGASIDNFVEYASERSGILLTKFNREAIKFAMKSSMVNHFVRKAGDKTLNVRRAGTRLRSKLDPKKQVSKLLRDAGYHGIAAEVFEERVGDIARLATGEMTWNELIDKSKDWENWAAEVLAFAMPIGGGVALGQTSTAIDAGLQRIKTRALEKTLGTTEQEFARENIRLTTEHETRQGVEVEPTQLAAELRKIHERDGGDIQSVTRTYLMERGGPYTNAERSDLNEGDSDPSSQHPTLLTRDELAARPRQEREAKMEELEQIVYTGLTPKGERMEPGDIRMAQARRQLAELYRIQRQNLEIPFFIPSEQEPGVPQADDAILEHAQADLRSDVGAGRPGDQGRVGRTARFVHLSREDVREGGILRRFAGTGAIGKERARVIREGVVDLDKASVNLYRSGRRGEFVVINQSRFLNVIEGNFNLLSKLHSSWAAVRAEMRNRTDGKFDYDVLVEVAKERGFEGYIETEEDQPTEGFVTLWRDIAPEEIVETEELTPQRRRELAAGAALIKSPDLYKPGAPNAVRQFMVANKGVTYEPIEDRFEEHGFAVSPFPEREHPIQLDEAGGVITPEAVQTFMDKNEDILRANPNARVGGWYDSDNGVWYLDITEIFETQEEATDVARAAAQKAIFNLDTGQEIVVSTDEEVIAARATIGLSPPVLSEPDSAEDEPGDTGPEPDRGATSTGQQASLIDFLIQSGRLENIGSMVNLTTLPAYRDDTVEGAILRARAFLMSRGHQSLISEVPEEKLSDEQKSIVTAIEKMYAEALTIDPPRGALTVAFYTTIDGKPAGLKGVYDPHAKVILLDANHTGEENLRQTFTHEWVHFLQDVRYTAYERFRRRIRAIDETGHKLAALDYYRRLQPKTKPIDMDDFLLWYESDIGQSEATAVYVDQRMESTGFYELIMRRDTMTFELYRANLTELIENLGERHQDVQVLVAIKDLADSYFIPAHKVREHEQYLAERDKMYDAMADLRPPEPHSEILAAGMRSLNSISRAKFEASGLIAKPWVEVDENGLPLTPGTPLFHVGVELKPGMKMSADKRGLVFFARGNEYGANRQGNPTTTIFVPEDRIAVISTLEGNTPLGEEIIAATKNASKKEIFEEAEKRGFLVAQQGQDLSMRPATVESHLPWAGAITHREAKKDPDLAMYWASEMQKVIDSGAAVTKDIIRVSGKLVRADKIMAQRQQQTAEFEGRPGLMSGMVNMMIGREMLDIDPTGKRAGTFKKADIGRALDKRARKLGHVIKFNDKGVREYKGKQRERIVESLMEEIQMGFASGTYSGSGWYDEKIRDMIHWTAKSFPELAVSPSHAAIFKYIVAITSNGNVVRRNYIAAKKIYGQWRDSVPQSEWVSVTHKGKQAMAPQWGKGHFPTVNHNPTDADDDLIPMSETTTIPAEWDDLSEVEIGGSLWSMRGWIVRGELMRLNRFMRRAEFQDASGTPTLFINWLLEEMTVGEIRQDPIVDKKHAVSEEGVGLRNLRVLYLGPKIGVFFQNMMGIHDLLTMDIWFARTWNRLTGTMMLSPAQKKKAMAKAHEVIKEMDPAFFPRMAVGFEYEKVIANQKVALQWALQADRVIQADNARKVNSELKKVVDRMKNASEGIVENPGTGGERARIREVFLEVQARLQEYGKKHNKPHLRDIKMSDIQAVLWYNEQAFYQAFGVSKAQTASENFGDAAKRDFQESTAASGRTDAATAVFVGGGRLPDGRGRGRVAEGAGDSAASARDEDVEAGLAGAVRRPDGGVDIDLTAARQRLIDAGYTPDDAAELVTKAVIDVTSTNTRRLSVVIDALVDSSEKTLAAGVDILLGRKPVTGKQQSLFVDPPVKRAARKRKTPAAKMGPREAAALRQTLRSEEKGRKAGKRQGLREGKSIGEARAVERARDIVGQIFGEEAGAASQNEVKAMNKALLARTPTEVTMAAVNLIRATAQVQRAKLHRRLKEERQAAVRGERQKGKDKAAALQDLKETLLRIIQRSGLSPTMQNKFKADLVTASTPAAIGRAFKKIELLAAKERFKDAVKKFTAMETSAKRAGRKVLSNDDRTQIGQWIQQAESAIFAPITAETAQRGGRGALTGVSRRPRSFLTAAQYDNATSSAAVTTELIAELVNERRAEKNRAAVGEKTTRAENVKQIQTNLGYDEESDTYAKELTVSRHMQEHNDREASFRGLRAEAYEDTESTTRRAEGWQREENLGVLTRLISRRMKEQEEEYNSELRDENQVVEQFLKEAGFKNLSHAYMQLMGTFGRSQTRMETVTLGGVDTSITLDEVLEFLALDPQTLAKIAKGRLLKVKSMTQRLAKAVTIEEIEEIRAKFEPQYGALVQAMKARIQNNLQPRLFAVIMRLKGAEPEFVPEYWPTIVDRAATEAAGLAQAYREGGTFGVILSMYQENLGLTLARDENATAPFVINGLLSRYIQHTDSALKIIHMAEATREASATLLSPKVADAINRTSGKKVYNNLKTMLAEASLAGRDTIPGGTDRLQVANAGVAATLILTNPGTYIRQLGGIPLLWSEMPHKYFMKGIARLRPGTFKEMQRWSGFFWARYSGDSMSRYSPVAGSTIDGFDNIAMTQALKALMKTGWSRDWKGFGMSWNRALRTIKLLDWFDSIAARIAWEGYKAQAEDLHPEFTFQQKMRWVSNRASMAARSSQNTSSPLDAGGVVMNTRDSFWRYFFLFTTQPMKSLNQLKLAWHDSPRQGFVASAGVFSNWIWSAYATNLILEGGSEILGTLIANAFGDDPDEDLRQERMMRMFMKMNFRMVQDVLGTVPVAGDAFAHMIEAISQRTRSGGALDAVVFENINDTVDDFTRNVRKAINALIEDGAEEEFYWAVYKANKALVTGAFDLVGNPLHMPYYRARRILEPVQGALPEPANIFFGFEEP